MPKSELTWNNSYKWEVSEQIPSCPLDSADSCRLSWLIAPGFRALVSDRQVLREKQRKAEFRKGSFLPLVAFGHQCWRKTKGAELVTLETVTGAVSGRQRRRVPLCFRLKASKGKGQIFCIGVIIKSPRKCCTNYKHTGTLHFCD